MFETCWVKIEVPAAKDEQVGQRHLIWTCNGESTLWIDGQPAGGLDVGHPSSPLPDHAHTLWVEIGTWQTAIWAPGPKITSTGCRFESAVLGQRDEKAWKRYHSFKALQEALIDGLLECGQIKKGGNSWEGGNHHRPPVVENLPVHLRRLMSDLRDLAVLAENDDFDSFDTALEVAYRSRPATPERGDLVLCGHSHLDLVWKWPEAATVRKALHTCSTVLNLMDRYPEFTFVMTQPWLYDQIAKANPTMMEHIQQRIEQGRWEILGAMDVESDVLIPCGEGLARNMVWGQKKIEALSGKKSKTVWIPDVFGYSGCLPQLMRLVGADTFYTAKMTWSRVNRFPYTSFTWIGQDGSEVLTHLGAIGFNGDASVAELREGIEGNQQAGEHPVSLAPTGYGDGGGGPSEEHLERARRFLDLSLTPRARWGRVDTFFEELRKHKDRLPRHRGEMYLECHRGTYTSQGQFKYNLRMAENALRLRESALVLLEASPLPYEEWERVIFAQFHDAIPGSSIREVYEEMNPQLESVVEHQEQSTQKALLQGEEEASFNPLPFSRRALQSFPGPRGFTQEDHLDGGNFAVVQSDGLSVGPLDIFEDSKLTLKEKRLSNGSLSVDLDESGRPLGITCGEKTLSLVEPASLALYGDHPTRHDAWEVDQLSLVSPKVIPAFGDFKVIEKGPHRISVASEGSFGEGSSVRWVTSLVAGESAVRLRLEVDWHERHRLLKFHLPTGFLGRFARYGCPFGSIERPQLPGPSQDEGMWELPASRWAAVTDDAGQAGWVLCSEAKYGFSCRNGLLALSLLRAATDPDPEQDQGHHVIEFAIAPWTDEKGAGAARLAESLYQRNLTVQRSTPLRSPFRIMDAGSTVPVWTLPSNESGCILRLHEASGLNTNIQVDLDPGFLIQKVDLMETTIEDLGQPAGPIEIPVQPYQIISLKITRGV